MGENTIYQTRMMRLGIMMILGVFLCLLFAPSLQAAPTAEETAPNELDLSVDPDILEETNIRNPLPDQNLSNTRSLILSDAYSEHFLSPYLTKYHDPEKSLTADVIVSGPDITGEVSEEPGSIVTLGNNGGPVWVSMHTVNRSSQTKWKLDFGNSFMGRFGLFDHVEAYVFNKNTQVLQKRNMRLNGSIFLDLPIDQKSQIILKFDFGNGLPTTTPIRILHESHRMASEGSIANSITMSGLVGMIFFFAAVAVMRGRSSYLTFSLFYMLFAVLIATQNTLVTGNISSIGSYLIPLMFLIIAICGLLIARVFWNIHEQPKIYDFLILLLILGSLGVFAVGFILPFDIGASKYAMLYGPSLLIITLIPILSIVQSQRGNNEVTAFMFGWFILLFGVCITILSLAGIMPTVSTAVNAYLFTLVPQAFFFAVAAKIKFSEDVDTVTLSRTFEIEESETVTRLRESKENSEQERLLKVIEQERKVLSELRKSEARQTEEMRKAKNEADQANSAKSAFLAVVSHEIRTPMTGIMGMVKLLLNSNLTKEQKEYAQTVQESSDAMLALLNDILDFEKIEQGKMALENISFDLHRLIQGVATLMNGHASQKDIELKVKIGDNLPKYVKGDPTRLRQILLNLTGNAVKFTNDGHVTITAELMDEKTKGNKAEIYFGVTDSGVGISKEAQEKLFKPFAQADSSVSRKFGGTGLGLAISKGLVENMGSTININSNEGEGSTFFFTLNMDIGSGESGQRKEDAAPKKPVKDQRKILVVDDNDVNQKVIQGFLKHLDYDLVMSDSAEDAISKMEMEEFDLVLMDIELPGMNGDEAAEKIRKSSDAQMRKIPIIALTGNVMPQHVEAYQAKGINGILAKPIDSDLLISTIKKAGEGVFQFPARAMVNDDPAHTKEAMADETAEAQEKKEKKVEPTQKKKTSFKGASVNVRQKLDPVDKSKQVAKKIEPVKSKKLLSEESEPTGIVFDTSTVDTLQEHISKADIEEMLGDVIKKSAEIIDEIQDALSENKGPQLSSKAHELKGMTANFGLVELSAQASLLEAKAKTEATIILTGLVDPLPDMQKRAQEALDQWLGQN